MPAIHDPTDQPTDRPELFLDDQNKDMERYAYSLRVCSAAHHVRSCSIIYVLPDRADAPTEGPDNDRADMPAEHDLLTRIRYAYGRT